MSRRASLIVIFLGTRAAAWSAAPCRPSRAALFRPSRAGLLRLCAEPPPTADDEDDAPGVTAEEEPVPAPVASDELPWWRTPVKIPTGEETKAEALRRIFVSEFGAQVAALTLAFVAFLVWSSTALTSEFWMTPL